MSDLFNPYREWLGLESSGAKPDHYALLGLPRGEQDPQRIQQAAERATVRVRSHRPGAQAADWARVLDEIQAAKNCLVDPQARAAYDRNLPGAAGATSAASSPSGSSAAGVQKLLGAAPAPSAAPRMEMEVSQPQRDLLPPRPVAPATNPAPVVAPAAAAPMNPAPYASPAMMPPAVATAAWNPAPTMPAAAWNTPTAMPASPAQPWGAPPMAAPAPMAPAYGYPASPASDPMAPANYGAPMAPALPAAYAQPAYAQPGYGQSAYTPTAYAQPAAMDPMAPAYGAYGAAPPAPTMYGAPTGLPAPYAPAGPMQPMTPPSAYYATPEAALPMAAMPVAVAAESYAAPESYSLGIGPPQAGGAPVAVPTAAAVAAPVGMAVPASANAPLAVPASPSAGESEVSIRATRPRRGNNLMLLVGAGGVALLLLAIGMVFMNQAREPVVAQNPPSAPAPPPPSSDLDSSERPPAKPSLPPSSVEPAKPEPPSPEPVMPERAKPTPMSEPVKPEPPKPEPSRPEPAKPEPPKPQSPKSSEKPTKAELALLSKLLIEARQALRAGEFEQAQAKLAEVEPLPKTADQAVVVSRLEQLTMQAAAYREAFEQGKQKLAVGQTLVVTASTQPEILELDAEKITISNKGEKRSYEWKTLPQGLFFAIADSAFEAGDVQQKVQRGAYVIALADDARDADKGKALWQEAIDGGAPLTQLLPVIGDKYELANLEMVAKVEPPEMKPESPASTKPDSPSPKPNANSTAALPLLKKARDEIGGHQFSEAQALLAKAAPLLANDDQQAKHTRLTLLLDYTKQFKDAIDRTLARLESGNTFEVGRTVVSVVEVRPREVVVRVNGTNRTYQRTEMPIGMAVALGDMSLQKDTPEAKLVRGAYVVACSSKPEEIEKAKGWWTEAAGRVDVKSLFPVINDTYTK